MPARTETQTGNCSKFTGTKKLIVKPVCCNSVEKMKSTFISSLLFACIVNTAFAQQRTITVQFLPLYNSAPVELGKKYLYKSDSIEIETLKFYISGIQFYKDGKLVGATEKKHHLVDAENPASFIITNSHANNAPYNRLRFSIGVDSVTNEAGAIGGDLDPTNGMYWEWRSGYINVKLEGHSRLCPARRNQFAFHIGGYQYPYNTIQNLDLPVANNDKIIIGFDVSGVLNQINLGELYEAMSPSEKAMGIAKKIGAAFRIEQ